MKTENNSNQSSKILGIQWDEKRDVFIYDVKYIFDQAENLPIIKRNILKILATSVFILDHVKM